MKHLIELYRRRLRRRRPALAYLFRAALVLTLISLAAAVAAERPAPPPAQPSPPQPSPAGREIFIPEQELPLLLQSWPNATMLFREEFQQLLDANARLRVAPPPRAALLTTARHLLVVEDNRAFWSCRARAEALVEGQQVLELPTANIVWTHLASGEQPAPATRAEDGVSLLLNGPGACELLFQGEIPVSTDAATRTLTLTLPPSAVATLDLLVPGDVAMRSGPSVLSRSYDDKKGVTRFELNPPLGPAVIVLTLNNRFKQSESLIDATVQLAATLSPAGEQLEAEIAFDIRHQAATGCQILLPAGFEVIDVHVGDAAGLAEWSLSPERVLSMRFITPQQGVVLVSLSLFRAQADPLGPWSFPICRPLACQRVSYRPSLSVHPSLGLSALRGEGVLFFPIGKERLLPQLAPADAAAPLTLIRAYAPGQFSLSGDISKKAPGLTAHVTTVMNFGEDALTCGVDIRLQAELEPCFQIALIVPKGWLLASNQQQQDAPVDSEVEIAAEINDRQQLIIRFPQGIWPGQSKQLPILFTHTPLKWHDAWTAPRQLDVPVFRVADAREQHGVLALKPLRHGYRSEPTQLESCLAARGADYPGLADCPLVCSYRDPSCRLSLSVSRLTPRLRADSYSLFQVHPDYIAVSHEIITRVDRAPIRELSFVLPVTTPDGLSVVSGNPAQAGVKDYSQQDSPEGKLFKVILDRETSDAHLLVTYQLPFQHDGAQEPLPLIRAHGVAYQAGRVAIEGGAELDVSIGNAPRKIDVGELAPFLSQPGKRLLGVYAYTHDVPAMTLDIKRQAVHPLPACLTARCQATMVLSPRGVTQVAVNYALHPNLPAISLRLPEHAVLWAITLDGQPATAQRASSDARDVLLPLPPPAEFQAERSLQVTYELPTTAFTFWGTATAALPALSYRSDDDSRLVPTADLSWQLFFPENFRLLSYAGTLSPRDLVAPAPIAPSIGKLLYQCTGGVHFSHGCLGIFLLPALSAAREKAMAAQKLSIDYVVDEEMKDSRPQDGMSMGGMSAASAREKKSTRRLRKAEAGDDGKMADRDAFKADLMALEATRSLDIAIVREGRSVSFRSLGDDPRLAITLVNARALRNGIRGLVLLIFCVGLLPYFHHSWRRKIGYLAALLLASGLLPCVPALAMSTLLLNEVFVAALLLFAVYVCVGAMDGIIAALLRVIGGAPRSSAPAATVTLLALLLIPVALQGQDATTGVPVATLTAPAAVVAAPDIAPPVSAPPQPSAEKDPAPPKPVQIITPTPLPMPADAVIVPYRGIPSSPTGNVLVPYGFYQQLLRGAQPPPPPAQRALFSAVEYRARLVEDDALLIEATLFAHVPTHGPSALPLLSYAHAIPGDLAIDGQPASVWLSEKDGQSAMGIFLAKAGSYKVTFSLRTPITRQGGWRCVTIALPAPGPAALRLETTRDNTEIICKSPHLNWTQRCPQAGSVVNSASDGSTIQLQWRAVSTRNEVDPTLAVQSAVYFTLGESALELVWQPRFLFQNQDRSLFDVEFPAQYRLQALQGMNVRGWETRSIGDRTRVSVHLLKPAEKEESFVLRLAAAGPGVHPAPQSIVFPDLAVPDAARHHASVIVRRQCSFEVRTDASAGVSRIDPVVVVPLFTLLQPTTGPLAAEWSALSAPNTQPLFEAWQYTGVAAPLRFHLAPYPETLETTAQLLFQLAPAGRHLEGTVMLKYGQRFQPTVIVRLPGELAVYAVQGPDLLSYHVASSEDGQTLELQLNNRPGQTQTTVHVAAKANDALSAGQSMALPQLRIEGAASQQTDIAIQCPPAFQLQVKNLDGLEQVLRDSFSSWLPPLARAQTAMTLRAKNARYQGRIAVRQKDCVVTGFCLSNLSFTPTALAETVLFDLRIDGALPSFSFSASAHLAEAAIEAPALRSQRVEPIADSDRVRFTLVFQDAISGNVRILLRHDYQVPASELLVTVPQSEATLKNYLIIENRGRDEIGTSQLVNATPLDRGRQVPPILQPLLQGNNLQFFDLKDANASLLCTVKARETVSTAGARIGLASTLLMLDQHGLCRGELTLQVDNRTEQFLVITMPDGAALWTAKVAGELIKPVIANDQPGNRVWIPLVKTAEGDLDYQVVLKYSAALPQPGLFRRTVFPLIKVDNVNVERSQLSLRLPLEYKWLAFQGTFGEPVRADSYQAVQLDYQGSVAKRLNAALQSADSFTQMRAMSNIGHFNAMVEQSQLGSSLAMPQEALQQTQQAVSALNQQLASVSQMQAQQAQADPRGYFTTLNAQQKLAFAKGDRNTEYQFQLPLPTPTPEVDSDALAELNPPAPANAPRPTRPAAPDAKPAAERWQRFEPTQPTPTLALDFAEVPADSAKKAKQDKSRQVAGKDQNEAARLDQPASVVGGMGMGAPGMGAAAASGPVSNSGMGGDMGGAAGMGATAAPAPAAPAAGANLASLDIVLPGEDASRWQTVFFSAPRDASVLTARSLSTAAIIGLRRFAYLALVTALLAGIAILFARKGRGALAIKCPSRAVLLQIAAISIIFGLLPVLGLVLLVLSFFMPHRVTKADV